MIKTFDHMERQKEEKKKESESVMKMSKSDPSSSADRRID